MAEAQKDAASALFKRVAEGWLFRAPNPWVFGDAPHYLVTDVQKEAISAKIQIKRPVVAALVVIAGVFAWVVAAAFLASLLGSDSNGPTTAFDFILITTMCVVPVVGALPAIGFIQRKRLANILAHAPETSQRIELAEIGTKLNRSISVGQIRMAFFASTFAAAAQVCALWIHLAGHRFALDPQTIFTTGLLVLWIAISIVWLLRWRKKAVTVDGAA